MPAKFLLIQSNLSKEIKYVALAAQRNQEGDGSVECERKTTGLLTEWNSKTDVVQK